MISRHKQLSVNKLAEYLDAKPSRRATIVRQQMEDRSHPAQYYILAQTAMKRVLASSVPDTTFEVELKAIRAHTGWGPYPEALIKNNADALAGLWKSIKANYPFENISFRSPVRPFEGQLLGDVRITNRLDLESLIKGRSLRYGGIKFYINKDHALTDLSGKVLAAMLYEVSELTYGKKAVDRGNTLVIDAFHSRIFAAPNSTKQLCGEAAAAANEFSIHWAHLASTSRVP